MRAGLLNLLFSCSPACYLTASKALKVILDICYQYAIIVSLSRHDPFVYRHCLGDRRSRSCRDRTFQPGRKRGLHCDPCSATARSFQLLQYLRACSNAGGTMIVNPYPSISLPTPTLYLLSSQYLMKTVGGGDSCRALNPLTATLMNLPL